MIALLVWRGPEWSLVADAFRLVAWEWVVAAIALNLALGRSRARPPGTRDRAGDAAADPPFRAVFSAFGVGLFANAVLPGRIGELARVAVLSPPPGAAARRRLGDARRHGLRAPRLRPLPGAPADRVRARDGEDPALGADEPADLRRRRVRRSSRSHSRARGATIARCSRRPGSVRRLVTMARYGLGVMRAPVPAAIAALLQCARLDVPAASRSGRRCARSTSTSRCPRPGSCCVLMNVAMLFPLWPGNVGLVQAAVALPLVSYGVPYAEGLRVRDRPAGDRDVRRRRRRP